MRKGVILFSIIFIFLIVNVSAFNFEDREYGLESEPVEIIAFDNDTGSVNHSTSTDIWITNVGSLDDVNDTQMETSGVQLNIKEAFLKSFGWITTWLLPDLTSGWFYNDSTKFYFNETKFDATYHNPTSASAITGTIDGGTLADIQHPDAKYDGVTFNFSEEVGGLDLRINFSVLDVDTFNRGIMRYKTSNLKGDFPIVQMWSYTEEKWEDYPYVVESETFATMTQPVFDGASHIEDGVAQMRIYKDGGNTQNHYYVDWIAIISGIGLPSGEEVDPVFNSWLHNASLKSNLSGNGYSIKNISFIGIGTSNPTHELNVVGDLNVTGTSYLGDFVLNGNITPTTTGVYAIGTIDKKIEDIFVNKVHFTISSSIDGSVGGELGIIGNIEMNDGDIENVGFISADKLIIDTNLTIDDETFTTSAGNNLIFIGTQQAEDSDMMGDIINITAPHASDDSAGGGGGGGSSIVFEGGATWGSGDWGGTGGDLILKSGSAGESIDPNRHGYAGSIILNATSLEPLGHYGGDIIMHGDDITITGDVAIAGGLSFTGGLDGLEINTPQSIVEGIANTMLFVHGGKGNSGTNYNGSIGSNITMITGPGGNTNTQYPGDAGNGTFIGGIGGTQTRADHPGGKGGNLYFEAGPGGAGSETGPFGNIFINRNGGGILIGSTNISKVNSTNLLYIEGTAQADAWLVNSNRDLKSNIVITKNSSTRFGYEYNYERQRQISVLHSNAKQTSDCLASVDCWWNNETSEYMWIEFEYETYFTPTMFGLMTDDLPSYINNNNNNEKEVNLYSLASDNYIGVGQNQDRIEVLETENQMLKSFQQNICTEQNKIYNKYDWCNALPEL